MKNPTNQKDKQVKIYMVARGGKGAGREKSHQYGEVVLRIFKDKGLKAHDLYLHPNGLWTVDGLVKAIEEVLPTSDYVYIAFVGLDGESGALQEMCEKHGVKYSGNNSFHSRLMQDKDNFKKFVKSHGIKSPYAYKSEYKKGVSNLDGEAGEIFSKIEIPMIIKANKGSGVEDVHLIENYQELKEVLKKFFDKEEDVLAEKLIRGELVKVLVHPYKESLHVHVYSEHPNQPSQEELVLVRDQALKIHSVLGAESSVEYDFVVDEYGVNFLEANSHPDLLHSCYNNFWKSLPISFEDYVLSTAKA
jgi:D-alanine-D-alanine ligase-like ATP-grasp enzyme